MFTFYSNIDDVYKFTNDMDSTVFKPRDKTEQK